MTTIAAVLSLLIGRPADPPSILTDAVPREADRCPARVYIARLSIGSRRAQTIALRELARLLSGGRLEADVLPWHLVRYQHAAAVRAVLQERHAPGTVKRTLAALRETLREAWQLGLMSAEDYHRAAAVKNVKGEHLLAGRALSHGELRRLFLVCAEELAPVGRRNAALLALIYGLGLRRMEAVSAQLEDFDHELGALRVLHAKGNRQRQVYAGPGTLEALRDYCEVRGAAAGPLLLRWNQKRGAFESAGISHQRLYEIIEQLGARAGIADFSPHDCRRTYISDLLDAGVDLNTVRQLVGHATITTTAAYDRRGEQAKIRAVALLPVPYMPPRAPRKPQDAFGETGEAQDTGEQVDPLQEAS